MLLAEANVVDGGLRTVLSVGCLYLEEEGNGGKKED
jgi:hypothetical protein